MPAFLEAGLIKKHKMTSGGKHLYRLQVRFCFSAVCDFFVCLFVPPVFVEPLNGFAPNSQGRRVWTIAPTSLNVKVKGQSHQGQKFAVHSYHPNGTRSLKMTPRSSGRHHCVTAGDDFGDLRAVYVW